MEGGAWWAAVYGVAQSRTRLSDFTFTFHFDALEKEMATHSSVLAWRIPWREEPGKLQSTGAFIRRSCVLSQSLSHVPLFITPWTPVRLLCPRDHPDKNTGVGSHSLLQGIFSTQGSNLGLPH